eukprot:357499-Chlamydomonas_euryale.AAC.10
MRVGLNDERCLPFTVHPVTGGEPSPTCRTHTRGVSHTLVEPPTQPQMTIDQHLLAALSVQGRFPHCNSNLMSTRQSRASSCDLLIVSTPPLTTAVTILEYLSAYLIVAYLALGTQAIALSQMDAVTTGNARPPNPITLFAGSKSRAPLILQDVKTDASKLVNVGMVDSCQEAYLQKRMWSLTFYLVSGRIATAANHSHENANFTFDDDFTTATPSH